MPASTPFRIAGRESRRSPRAQSWGTVIAGGALAVYGLTRKSTLGVAIAGSGGALAYYGLRSNSQRAESAYSSILLNCSPSDAFRFWRDFENLPRFMNHLESVVNIGERRLRWTMLGPLGRRISWNTEITNEEENRSISWRSLPGSDLSVNGSVTFEAAPANRGTILTANVQYSAPAAAAAATAAKLIGKEPSFMMRQDLRRLKALIETGEIPTIEGQAHGPRSMFTGVARVVNPDRAFPSSANIADLIEAERRIS